MLEDISIQGVELRKDVEIEEDATKALLVVTEEIFLVNKTEISEAYFLVQEQNWEAISLPRNDKKESEDLLAGVKYHTI